MSLLIHFFLKYCNQKQQVLINEVVKFYLNIKKRKNKKYYDIAKAETQVNSSFNCNDSRKALPLLGLLPICRYMVYVNNDASVMRRKLNGAEPKVIFPKDILINITSVAVDHFKEMVCSEEFCPVYRTYLSLL